MTAIRSSPLSLIGQPIAAPIAASSAIALEHPRAALGVGEDLVRSRAGQRRQRVDRRIAPQFVPDRAADIVGQVGPEPGLVEQRRTAAPMRSLDLAAGLADDQLVGMLDARLVGRRAAAGGVDDAADDLRRTAARRRCVRPGSTERSGSPSMNHQGTPLSIGTIMRLRARSAASSSEASAGRAGALTAMITTSCAPSACGSSDALDRCDELPRRSR